MKMLQNLLVLAIFASSVSAQTLVVTKSGYYLLSQDSNGVPQLDKINNVIILDSVNPIPTPTPTPTPTPNPLTDRSKKIMEAAKVVNDPVYALKTAAVYRQLLLITGEGKTISTTEMLEVAVKVGTTEALKGSTKLTEWQNVRDLFGNEWTLVLQKRGSLQDYAKLLDETASGLEASVPNSDQYQIDINMIIQIITLIISILKALFPQAIFPM